MSGPAAGWYNDPEMVNTRRYWDGEKWTQHRQEKTPVAVPQPVRETPSDPGGYVVLAGVGLAVFLPIVGLLMGLVLLNRYASTGLLLIVLSCASFVGWYYILSPG